MKNISLRLIRLYQAAISPLFVTLFGSNLCKFTPTCSEYAYQAVQKYGILKGTGLGIKRIVRCHPFAKGGHDPLL